MNLKYWQRRQDIKRLNVNVVQTPKCTSRLEGTIVFKSAKRGDTIEAANHPTARLTRLGAPKRVRVRGKQPASAYYCPSSAAVARNDPSRLAGRELDMPILHAQLECLGGELGSGSYGTVWLGKCRRHGEGVALKMVPKTGACV